jgi:hypothetical protein
VPELPDGTPVEIWFQDEARVGQKNGLVRQWARPGTRPRQPADPRYESADRFGAICPARGVGAALALPFVNGTAILPKSGGAKFPSLAGWRSAVGVIGACVLRWTAATLQGRWNGIGGGVRLEADVFRQKVGVLAQPIARPFDLDNDSVVKQSVEKGGRDDGVAEDVAPLGEATI